MKINQLYPPQIDEVLIEPQLQMKGPAKGSVKYCWHGEYGRVKYHPLLSNRSFNDLNEDRILGQWEFDKSESFALMDKMRPHSLYNLMLISSGKNISTTYYQHSPDVQRFIWKAIYGLVDAASDKSIIENFKLDPAFFHFAFNIDGARFDRESFCSESRFHVHLNIYNSGELSKVSPVPFKTITNPRVRMELIDPLHFIGISIIKDAIKEYLYEDISELESDPQSLIKNKLPVGLILKLKDGWKTIEKPTFANFMATINKRINFCFHQLREAFHVLADQPLPWTRHKLLSHHQIMNNLRDLDWLSYNSLEGLSLLATTLRDMSEATITRLKSHPALLTRHLAYGGLCYSAALMGLDYSSASSPIIESKNVVLCLQTKLFSPHGGAGLLYLPNAQFVKLNKCSSVYSDDDIRVRTEFHQEMYSGITSYLTGTRSACRSANV